MVSRAPTSENSDKLHLQAKATQLRCLSQRFVLLLQVVQLACQKPAIDSSTHVVSFVTLETRAIKDFATETALEGAQEPSKTWQPAAMRDFQSFPTLCTNPIGCTELCCTCSGIGCSRMALVGCTQIAADMSGLLQRILPRLDDTHLAVCIAVSKLFETQPANRNHGPTTSRRGSSR